MNIKSPVDCLKLQEDIDAINNWGLSNGLPLNIKKCFTFSFYRGHHHWFFNYSIGGSNLSKPDIIIDLGVTFDKKLSFIPHINKVISKAYAMLGFIIKCSREFKDPYTIKALFCSMVRSILEYASQLWSPSYASHIKRMESIQKKFLLFALRRLFSRVDFTNLPSYNSRLLLLDMNTLHARRTIADLLFVCKLISGSIRSPNLLANMNFNTSINPRRQSNLLYLRPCRTNYSKMQPIIRMCETFNKFATNIDFNMSITQIRNAARTAQRHEFR